MESVILVIHLFLALAIVGLVLLQRSEGGGLGIGGDSGGGMGGLAGAKTTANFLTRATTICAVAFFATSLLLGVLARGQSASKNSILDKLDDGGLPVIEVPLADDEPNSIPDIPVE